jgi:hypothetical protein
LFIIKNNIIIIIKLYLNKLGATGIEPVTSAHETDDLPLIYAPNKIINYMIIIIIIKELAKKT